MKYFNKWKFYIFVFALILGTIFFCNYSYAQYKSRITINQIELNILPYETTDIESNIE